MNQKAHSRILCVLGYKLYSSKVLILLHNLHSSAFKCVKFHTLKITLLTSMSFLGNKSFICMCLPISGPCFVGLQIRNVLVCRGAFIKRELQSFHHGHYLSRCDKYRKCSFTVAIFLWINDTLYRFTLYSSPCITLRNTLSLFFF